MNKGDMIERLKMKEISELYSIIKKKIIKITENRVARYIMTITSKQWELVLWLSLELSPSIKENNIDNRVEKSILGTNWEKIRPARYYRVVFSGELG